MQEYFITLHYREYGNFDLSYTDDNGDIQYRELPLYEPHGRLALTASLGELTDEERSIFVDAAELDRPTLLYQLGRHNYPCAFSVHTADGATPEQKAQRMRSMANFDHLDRSKIGKLCYEYPDTVMDNENDDPILEMNRFLGIAENIVKERSVPSSQPDESNAQWFPWRKAVEILATKDKPLRKKTLDTYRNQGHKTGERTGYFKHEKFRIYWKPSGSKSNSEVLYLIPNDYPR